MPYVLLDPTFAVAAPAITLGGPKTSGSLSLAEMDARLNVLLAKRGDVDSPRRRDWINDAYVEVCESIEIPELRASFALPLVAGEALYNLPAGVRVVDNASIVRSDLSVGGMQLPIVDASVYLAAGERADWPQLVAHERGMLLVWPTPAVASVLHLDVWIAPERMTLDNHVPILPTAWHRAVVTKAKQFALSDLRDPAGAVAAAAEYKNIVDSKIDRIAQQRVGQQAGLFPARSVDDLRWRQG